jgi:2',3'-cyclic-nucleotide 2'-phosphodiesterase (5'-nucleotidase family)
VEDLIKKSKMVWLLSNVFDKTTNSNLAGALSYYIKDVRLTNDEMLKIGFIGLAEEEWLG